MTTGRPQAGPPRRPLPRVVLETRQGVIHAVGVETPRSEDPVACHGSLHALPAVKACGEVHAIVSGEYLSA